MADAALNRFPSGTSWSLAAEAYRLVDQYVSLPLSLDLATAVQEILPLDTPNALAFDNGCGPGTMVAVLKTLASDLPVVASDLSEGMIAQLQDRGRELGWKNVEASVVDARDLNALSVGAIPEKFSHVFSTFMVCLAQEPEKIMKEMFRVMKPGGILGLGVWAEPYVSFWNDAFTKAARELEPTYSPVKLMAEQWTFREEVEKRIREAGFVDVNVWETQKSPTFPNVEQLAAVFIEGRNPALQKMINSWIVLGRSMDEMLPLFTKALVELYGRPDGTLVGPVHACLSTARKPS
ncbi:uncharacterized protein KY384_000361 [Bacidia gigantensis]|uniref:uncharacterized protein n=1 Tax=Bacidia gigantensis TaxID=2732470 RepID=UPI001D04B9D3|nr:uncharacterized protein KY384_000361 [Bacidia gigantensis]KAG8526368.1 hypothetical protein KY384_000361 [Bacidia gigantensis]